MDRELFLPHTYVFDMGELRQGARRRREIRAFREAPRAARLHLAVAGLPEPLLFGVLIGLCFSGLGLRFWLFVGEALS